MTHDTPDHMTPDEFRDWTARHGLTRDREVCEALGGGIALATVNRMRHGALTVSPVVARLCRFIDQHGVDGWLAPKDRQRVKREREDRRRLRIKVTAYGYALTEHQLSVAWSRIRSGKPFQARDIEDRLIRAGVPRDQDGRRIAERAAQRLVRRAKQMGEAMFVDGQWIAGKRPDAPND